MSSGKKIRPIDIVDKVEVPTLFIAGENDVTVHAWHSKSLYKLAKCKKHFELFKNCCHAEDLFFQDRKNFIDICKAWLSPKETEQQETSLRAYCTSGLKL